MNKWDLETDVVVVGSGGAAFAAALLAKDQGAEAAILERTDKLGGTTAISGGAVWIPMNSHMQEMGVADSREAALKYCIKLTDGRAADDLVETFVDTGHKMVEYIETHTPVRFAPMTMPDYHPEEEGAIKGGRSIEPQWFDMSQLGEWQDKVRQHPLFPFMGCVTSEELWHEYKVLLNAKNMPVELIMERMDKGTVCHGNALIGGLLRATLDRKIPILLETRGRQLIRDNGRVIGIRAERAGKDYFIKARGGVVLACGGFEWSEDLKKKYLQGAITHPNTPPFNEGDGVIMAQEMGADLANMSEAWWMPSTHVPGDEYEGRPYSNLCVAERTAPHSIIVNPKGKRFVNEASTYNGVLKPFFTSNENGTGYRNLPAWVVADSQYREKYTLMAVSPDDPEPDYFVKADTLEALAEKIGVDAAGLAETVERFNRFAREGKDRDFGRGDSAYDRFVGDKTTPHPVLGTLEKAPYFAIPIHPGSLGTKGGPRTNRDAQVLDVRGEVIPGLYAAGNAAAGVSGPSYYGGGGVIGLAMTFGYRAGIHAAAEAGKQR